MVDTNIPLKLKMNIMKIAITKLMEREIKNRRTIETLEDKYAILEIKYDTVKKSIVNINDSLFDLLLFISLLFAALAYYITVIN